MDLELKRIFVAIGRVLIENNYLGKSFFVVDNFNFYCYCIYGIQGLG